MMDEKQGVKVFLVTILLYLLIVPILQLFGVPLSWAFLVDIIIMSAVLWHWREWFRFKPRFDIAATLVGLIIFGFWVGLDPYYPKLVEDGPTVLTTISIVLKAIIGIIIAPIVEEFFTRFFLHRIVQKKHWLKVKLGTMQMSAFVVTTLFFGFAHNRWLAGLVTGALLNMLWYQRKDMNSVVLAHAVANLALAIFILSTGAWDFW